MRIGPLAAVAVSPHVPDGFVNGFTNSHGQVSCQCHRPGRIQTIRLLRVKSVILLCVVCTGFGAYTVLELKCGLLLWQDYPPGVVLVPMHSITGKPFNKTNLVIFSPSKFLAREITMSSKHAASGDVLIADPGCTGAAQSEVLFIWLSSIATHLFVGRIMNQ